MLTWGRWLCRISFGLRSGATEIWPCLSSFRNVCVLSSDNCSMSTVGTDGNSVRPESVGRRTGGPQLFVIIRGRVGCCR